MDLEIQQRDKENITILDLKGRLVAGEGAAALRETMRNVSAAGIKNLILNLKDVEYIDSTGLGTMVICFTSTKKDGGMVKLLNLNRRNVELLVLTKLTTVFELFNDEQDAINSFFPTREIKKFDILEFLKQQEKPE